MAAIPALSTQLFVVDIIGPDALDHLEDLISNIEFVVECGAYAAVLAF